MCRLAVEFALKEIVALSYLSLGIDSTPIVRDSSVVFTAYLDQLDLISIEVELYFQQLVIN